jgi:hypothetical protein
VLNHPIEIISGQKRPASSIRGRPYPAHRGPGAGGGHRRRQHRAHHRRRV